MELGDFFGFGALKGKRLWFPMVALVWVLHGIAWIPSHLCHCSFSVQISGAQAHQPGMRSCLGIFCIFLCCEGGKVYRPVSSVRGHETNIKETLRSRVGQQLGCSTRIGNGSRINLGEWQVLELKGLADDCHLVITFSSGCSDDDRCIKGFGLSFILRTESSKLLYHKVFELLGLLEDGGR